MVVLQKKLCDQHIMRLTVKWQEGGLSTDNAEHAQYVAEVTTSLTKQLTSTINTIIEEDQNKVESYTYIKCVQKRKPKYFNWCYWKTIIDMNKQ